MFRLQNNVPEVYVDKSRDFQLFCRMYDVVFGGVKFSIDSLQRASNTKECDESLLELLATKLGFFTRLDIDEEELRYVLQAFPTIIRYKGSARGIGYVVNLFQRLSHSSAIQARFEITDNHQLVITFSKKPKNDRLLFELLKYILPTGYTVNYEVAEFKTNSFVIELLDNVQITAISESHRKQAAAIRGSTSIFTAEDGVESDEGKLPPVTNVDLANKLGSTVGLTQIPMHNETDERGEQ